MPEDLDFYVVAYDITDDRRRSRVAKELLNFGDRIQDSVFECHLSRRRLERMVARLRELLDLKEDRTRIYRLCAECTPNIRNLGLGAPTEEPPDILIV